MTPGEHRRPALIRIRSVRAAHNLVGLLLVLAGIYIGISVAVNGQRGSYVFGRFFEGRPAAWVSAVLPAACIVAGLLFLRPSRRGWYVALAALSVLAVHCAASVVMSRAMGQHADARWLVPDHPPRLPRGFVFAAAGLFGLVALAFPTLLMIQARGHWEGRTTPPE